MSGPGSGLAPIVFFGYNRPRHSVWALESIKACPESASTPIRIYLDGPRSDEGLPAVEATRGAVRDAAPSHAEIICRDENMGLAASIRQGVTELCEEYGRVVVVEDDLVLAPTALTWFNRALERYRDDERVMHVAGYWPETRVELPPSFFLRWPSVWGWATWGRAWRQFEWDLERLRDELVARDLVTHFREGGWDFFEELEGTLEGRFDSWGIRWYATVVLAGGLALHPGKSLVANTGTDGSGVHGDESAVYRVELGDGVPTFPDEVAEEPEALRAWAEFTARRSYRPLSRRLHDRLYAFKRRLFRQSLD